MASISKVTILNIADGIATLKLEGTGFGLAQGTNQIELNSAELTITNWSDTEIIGNTNESNLSDIKRKFEQLDDVSGTLASNPSKFLKVDVGGNSIEYQTLGNSITLDVGTSPGNIPVLDANGKLVNSVINSLAISDTFVVASESAMLSLTNADIGDIAIRTDISKTFILQSSPYSTLNNWKEVLAPPGSVTSVNGYTGVVSLTAADVGAATSSHTHPANLITISNMVSGDYYGDVMVTTVAASQTIYNAVYMSTTGVAAARANSYATLPCIGLILETGTGARKVITNGFVKNTSWAWTKGSRIYVSPTTAGGLTQTVPTTAGQLIAIVGIAVETNVIQVMPDSTCVEI